MVLSQKQKHELTKSFRQGLKIFFRAPPLTGVEWGDKHFYLSAESSYTKGRWTTNPYQVAILNAMTSDQIKEVNWQKSARVGYTKLIVLAMAYFVAHKNRNICIWQPDDGARDSFSKSHIDSMIRDVKPIRDLAPWINKKHKNNTM